MTRRLHHWACVLLCTLLTSIGLQAEESSQPSSTTSDALRTGSDGVITMTTTRPIGEQLLLSLSAPAGEHVIAEGLKESLILDGDPHFYTLTSQTVTLRGNLKLLNCGLYQSAFTHKNQLTSLNMSDCNTLRELYCLGNSLQSLDVSGCNTLGWLNCTENLLQSLDVSGCNTLKSLNCGQNLLQSLDITHNEALTDLFCYSNQLETLDLSHARALKFFSVSNNRLTDIDLSQCLNLQNVDLDKNQLTSLDVSHNPDLRRLLCCRNPIEGERMTQLVKTLSDRTGLEQGVFVPGKCLKSDVAIAKAKNWRAQDRRGNLYEGDSVGDGVITMTTTRQVGEQLLLSLSAPAGEHVIAEGLKEPLILDGDPHFYTLTSQTVTLKGNLKLLICNQYQSNFNHKNQLTSLNLSGCNTLRELACLGNSLQSLDVSGCNTLGVLNCSSNSLQSLDVSGCNTLKNLNCSQNLLQSLDITHNEALTSLSCFNNQLETLDLSHARALTKLGVANNRLTDIDLSQCLNLQDVDLDNNQLTSLDVSHNPDLRRLLCCRNPIEGERMTQLVKTLSDRTGLTQGIFVPGKCLKSDVAIAKAKNWSAQDGYGNLYEGEDPITYIVTLSKEGEGTLTATGADDLTAVPDGTELTIVATPAEGYELTALTANGTDILATKKFVVKKATEVKATFTKKSFAVTLTKEGEGTLTATGADDLTAVPYGTELTIVATPAEGYELTALTANGTDILATKKFVVKGATEVKATFSKKSKPEYRITFTTDGNGTLNAIKEGAPFTSGSTAREGDKIIFTAQPATGYKVDKWLLSEAEIELTPYTGLATFECTVGTADVLLKTTFVQQTFAVTLTSNEHGTISIVENVDLKAVPYGTTLTVQATGKNDQCELTALTANGSNILATKQFVVKEATEVQATFVDHTSVETIAGHAVRIYPNPAQTFVLIEGLQPASQVSLYSMDGKQLYTGQTDQQGTLRIDLTALSDGVYLLVGEGWQKRLVVKQ